MIITKPIGKVNIKIDTNNFDRRMARNYRSAQKSLNRQIVEDTEPYIPIGKNGGRLRSSVEFPNGEDGGLIAYNTPYAHYMYMGQVYEDPVHHVAGWCIGANEDGSEKWVSRKGVKKQPRPFDRGPTRLRDIQYHNGGGAKWFERSKETNYEKWLKLVGKELTK